MKIAPDAAALRAFVVDHTAVIAPTLLPELSLRLATAITPLWNATERHLVDAGVEPPFWAFAWSGGQAVARYVLDEPQRVRGLRVLDFASGSGLVALAAVHSGAAHVAAVDLDPLAIAAVNINAELAGVQIEARLVDVLDPANSCDWVNDFDVITAGDICYDADWAPRAIAWLRERARRGALVLLGDPGRIYIPAAGLVQLARYTVTSMDDVDAEPSCWGMVYELKATAD